MSLTLYQNYDDCKDYLFGKYLKILLQFNNKLYIMSFRNEEKVKGDSSDGTNGKNDKQKQKPANAGT